MAQLLDFNQQILDKIQLILKPTTTKCFEYYSRANYFGFKRLSDEERDNGSYNSLGYAKAVCLHWKVHTF